jgi:hypothetical protein
MPEDRKRPDSASSPAQIPDPLFITRAEVLELLDRVLRRELALGEAYLFAVDIVESTADGTAKLEDQGMLPVLEELAKLTALTHDIVDEFRRRLRRPHEEGTA